MSGRRLHTTVTTYKRVEGVWTCAKCGHVNPGLSRKCEEESCGKFRNVSLYPSEEPRLPDDLSTARILPNIEAGSARNWNCGHCGFENPGKATVCEECNQPLSSDDTVNRVTHYRETGMSPQDYDAKKAAERVEDDLNLAQRTVDSRDTKPRRLDDVTVADSPSYTRAPASYSTGVLEHTSHRRTTMIWLGAALIVLMIGGVAFAGAHRALATVPGTVTVDQMSWETQTDTETFGTYRESDWSIPYGGRFVDSRREIRSYDHVLTGYTTESYTDYKWEQTGSHTEKSCTSSSDGLGDGTFGVSETCDFYDVPDYGNVPYTAYRQVPVYRDDPVYDTKYTYDIDRWVASAPLVLTGSDTDPVAYATLPDFQVGKVRLSGSSRQICRATLRDTTKQYAKEVPCTNWAFMKSGDTLSAKFRKQSGELVSISWPLAPRVLS